MQKTKYMRMLHIFDLYNSTQTKHNAKIRYSHMQQKLWVDCKKAMLNGISLSYFILKFKTYKKTAPDEMWSRLVCKYFIIL